MTMKLFVSYARVDKPLCKQIVGQLDAVHDVWYDRRLHAGMDWWAEIQAKLDWCEGFVYLLSPESVASEYCQKEFAIATDAGKHIFPVLIQARTKIPDSLSHIHYADLSQGMEDIITLLNAITLAERRQRKPVPKPAPKVQQPSTPPKDMRPSAAIPQAADAMDADNFDSAVFILKGAIEKKPTGRIKRMLLTMLEEAENALEKQAYLREAEREYRPIAELVKRERTRSLGCEEFADFQTHFPDYDPDELHIVCRKYVVDILLASFTWIDIPGEQVEKEDDEVNDYVKQRQERLNFIRSGRMPWQVKLENLWDDDPTYVGKKGDSKVFTVKAFAIAKYPITNAQYRLFIDAGGYRNRAYWTADGWQKRQKDNWTEPSYWQDTQWNSDQQPVVGVSWYEAYAYTQWLTEVSGDPITLPTEQQWQRAAQGDDGRTYLWGNEWDAARCQNSVDSNAGNTSPVTRHEGKGDSPFGVVDMAGNVWEWCLTANRSGSHEPDGTDGRVLRGGSWGNSNPGVFRCAFRFWDSPNRRDCVNGFRVARAYT